MVGLLRALKRGEIIALPCDRDFADNSRDVDFFGQPARLPYGPLRLSRRTGTPLLPAFVERLPDDTFRIHVEPPIIVSRSDDADADIEAAMKEVVSIMERHISRHPEQWLVAAPVWPLEGAQQGAESGGH
jgi:KDO2-lipid IV(A) lauroyltransferase